MAKKMSLLIELRREFPQYLEYDPEFHQTVVDHFPYIRKSLTATWSFEVTPLEAAIFNGDFHGLMQSKQIDKRYHFILTEFNGFKQSSDYKGTPGTFLKIDPEFIENLKKTFQSRRV